MALTIAAGVAVRWIWGVRVELFFEAFALFGCMALLELGEAPPARGADRRFRLSATLAIALTLLAVIAMNAALILNLSNAQSEEIGNTQLDVIRSDLQDTITEAQTELLRVELDGRLSMIFSSETSNNWYLILSVDTSALYGESYRQMAMMASVNLLMLAAVAVYALLSARKAKQAEDVVSETRRGLDGFSGKLRESAAHLMRLGDARLFHEDGDPKALIGQVHDSGQRLSAIAGDLSAWSDVLGEGAPQAREWGTAQSLEAPSRKVRNGIIISLVISLVIVLAFCIRISTNWGTSRMNREADTYENQLNEWLTEQKSILYMFTDVISSQPELLDNYGDAVRWLDDVSKKYPDISLCYMANPYNEHPVIMNNGWEPGEDYRPETRPWYRATERAADGFSISAPYLDA